MSQPHTPPSRPEGRGPSIRRAVRTSGPVDPSRPVATVRSSGPSLAVNRPAAQARPEPDPHWTDPTWDAERGRWRPSPEDAMSDWLAGRGAFLDDLPKLGEACTVRCEGSDNACGHSLLANGMCPNQAEHVRGVRPQSDPRGQISLDEQLANAGNPAARWRLDREQAPQASEPADPVEDYRDTQADEGKRLAAALDAAVEATASTALADGGDADNETTRDLVKSGIAYEHARMMATAASTDQRKWNKAKAEAMAEVLDAFTESGQASLSLIMPESGENRVLTPSDTVWPKVRPVIDPATQRPVLDENDQPVKHSTEARIAAIKAAGLAGDLLKEVIDTTALNALFDTFTTDDDIPEGLRGVYELAVEWKLSSTKGRRGRTRTPAPHEVANGRRAGTGE